MEQLSKQDAIKFYESGAWEEMNLMDRARFQLEQERLCMPFDKFHDAMNYALGRPIFTHEFKYPQRLKDELYEKRPKSTLPEILNLLSEYSHKVFVAKV